MKPHLPVSPPPHPRVLHGQAGGAGSRPRHPAAWLLAAALVLGLAGCAIEFQNRQPAQQLAREAQPPGAVYVGWRVFQDRCASCHGAAATGGNGATAGPDLLPRLREMGPRRFVNAVLRRYDLGDLPRTQAGADDAPARDALVDEVLQRRRGTLTMPAWEGEPTVSAHIADLYAYLAARAEGTQGPGRPAR